MNGYSNSIQRFLVNDDPISPQSLGSPSWAGRSSISNNLNERVLRGIEQPRATDRSVILFNQLPPQVIERILWAADANGFASLCILNRAWFQRSQNLELYAYHLSRCPSYALSNNVITGPFRKNDLYRLKAKFAAEVRRNLFDAYLRPRETHINLISVSANSSAAFPGGEAFRFEFSPNGRTVLAITSSRIYVLDASSDTIEIRRELKTVRRPISASVTDDGSLLAVLSSKYQANIYALNPGSPVKHLQVIVLDNPPRTIALAHEGTVLAAAWKGGIEVFSLAANALSTDRRAVRSEAVDSLMFSGDGSMLIGSSHDLEEPNAVVITAPFYTENDPNITPREIHSRMWTTQILFPQISSTVSHVALLPGHIEGDANWLFAYDHTLMSYRAVRTDDTRTGVAYFLSPPTAERFEFPQPNIAPVATSCGTLAAAGFSEHGLWIYGVPERLDISPDMGSVVERHEERLHGRVELTSATGHPEPLMAYSPSVSGSSEMIEEDGLAGKVDWRQSLFVKCSSIKGIEGFTSAKWAENSEEYPCAFPGKRLIVTAPAGVNNFAEDLGEENMPVDGSRICLLDFDYGPSTSGNREFTIEVGDNEAELLTEQLGNIEIEVAMERRRTVRATRGRGAAAAPRTALGRSHTAASPPNPSHLEDVLRRNVASQPSSPGEDVLSPMTRSSGLSRSQTAAGFQHARFPARPPLGSSHSEHGHHGQRLSHRGSTDSWETPPPPYGHDSLGVQHLGHRPHTSTPNLQHRSSNGSSNSTAINGNLAQLGTFQNRVLPRQNVASPPIGSSQSARGPYTRTSTTMDGMMISENVPSQRMMSQYGALARSPRPDGIPEESAEHMGNNMNGRIPPTTQSGYASNNVTSPAGNADAYFSGRRPLTQDGISPEGNLVLRPTMTHPMSPPTPDHPAWLPEQDQPPMPTPPGLIRNQNRVSLSGADLQNRLKQPVPPVPQDESPASPYGPSHNHVPFVQPTYNQVATNDHRYSNHTMSTTPTAEQMARLSRRQSPLPTPLQAGPPGGGFSHSHRNTASHDFGSVPPSPPRAAWGAAGVPGSPSFNRPFASHSRNNSRGSNIGSVGASRSTPNLLAPMQGQEVYGHSPRPSYGRLDTINSVNSAMLPHERAHSVAGGSINFHGGRIVTDPALAIDGKKGRKNKKRRDDGSTIGEKKGRRCIVM
ncbi:hypothetical protein PMZ80_008602 [Knufia obscura]|uniref:DUF7165 domain-containing protein n=1 Tax=Knufia obscura TaxID=1635080 RepID=A0ABR0RF93_9EURO|nr:hypothetical protein PMZ80_008602 [Knufia obscura]